VGCDFPHSVADREIHTEAEVKITFVAQKQHWTMKALEYFTHPCLLYRHFKSSRHEPDGRRPNDALQCAHFVGVNASVVLRASVVQYVMCIVMDRCNIYRANFNELFDTKMHSDPTLFVLS
jgi:hypothetical protein